MLYELGYPKGCVLLASIFVYELNILVFGILGRRLRAEHELRLLARWKYITRIKVRILIAIFNNV